MTSTIQLEEILSNNNSCKGKDRGYSCTDVMELFCERDSVKSAPKDAIHDDTPDEIIQVETFSPNISSVRPKQASEERNDPFLYYSNDETRINTLKSTSVSENVKQHQQKKEKRKTKISFELSPLMMMADMLDEFDGEGINDGGRAGGDCIIEQTMKLMLAEDDSSTESLEI